MAGTLRLVPYDLAWPARFAAEAARVRAALGAHALAVEHVGSTAVPGLAGKPVLDLGIAVASEAAADACLAPLVGLGYAYRGPYGDDPRRRYYVRDADGGARVAQVHLYVLPAAAWDEKLAFRDALRADPALAAAYAAEKRRVAVAVGWDKGAYSVAKGPFVERVLAELRAAGRLAALSPRAGCGR
ncbi:MAG: GrpB family protein [Gemmatimonadota bacterium]